MLPTIFFGHGSPMNAITPNEFAESWKTLGLSIAKPKFVLSISAHWETLGTKITNNQFPPTIHDFGGFPKELFEVDYPAPGSEELVQMITKKLPQIVPNDSWGLDHGTWSVLKFVFPLADVPIVQLSLDRNLDLEGHWSLAESLSFLREEGVLIIGSGNLVHNLRLVAWDKMSDPEFFYPWAEEADNLLQTAIQNRDKQTLTKQLLQNPAVQKAVPSLEHFLPALYIAALRGQNEPIQFFNQKPVMGSLSMTSFQIG
ncbi:4,5-DOPA dioxygenase extradiol [Leptospira sp. 96542]|nr:4,5-DOPA dioxygenase extradiol [Leptospira sp. 96542]